MLRTLLLVLGAATPAPGAAPFRVLWDSWFPTECRQFGDKTTAEDFAKFGITANRALDPGIPAVKPQQPVVNGTGTAGDAIILFYENFGLYPAIGSHAGNFSGTLSSPSSAVDAATTGRLGAAASIETTRA